jgi:hypothetical protein
MKYLNLSTESKLFIEKLIKICLLRVFPQIRYSDAMASAAATKVTISLFN